MWDINHALVVTRAVGREVFGHCFEQVTGYPMCEQAADDGMPEPVIFRETTKPHGIISARPVFENFAQFCPEQHQLCAGELRERGHALSPPTSLLDRSSRVGRPPTGYAARSALPCRERQVLRV
ncbi:hypothetical protein [[Kitasatospora] papulosa]|uniref:hypothetical protein n=1 Tax=[Kitasatospora] papulosa TaxID=1464011 RepID=UPI0036C0A6A7